MATAHHTRFGWSVPPEGAYWLAATVILVIAGWLKAINLILILAYGLAALWLLNVWLVRRSLRRVRAQRLWDGPVWAGQPAVCEAVISKSGHGKAPLFRVCEAGPGIGLAGAVERLTRENERLLRCRIVFSMRGRIRLPPLVGLCRAPWGLIERCRMLAPAEDIIVLPCRGTLHRDRLDRWLARVAHGDGRPHLLTRPSVLRDTDLYGLRPFRPGDSPRHIHWRTSARRGELMVREFADTQPRQLLLVVAPGGDVEALVSLAATLAWEWCRQADDQIWIALGGPTPRFWGPASIREQTLPAQAVFAELGPAPGDADRLLELAAAAPESAAPLVIGDAVIADRLERRLRRPIAYLAPGGASEFYHPPREKLTRRGPCHSTVRFASASS